MNSSITLCFLFLPSFLLKRNFMGFISGKAAILEIEIKSYDKESGDLLCMNR